MSRLCFFKTCLVLVCSLACSAQALTLSDLEQALRTSFANAMQFEELRESPWLQASENSHGVMYSIPPVLEKRVEFPRRETWRLYPEHIEWLGPHEGDHKKIFFSQAPQIALLVNAMRGIASGELIALEQDFNIKLIGNENNWTIRLKPRAADANRYLDFIEISGAASGVETIFVLEPQGERTTTRLKPLIK